MRAIKGGEIGKNGMWYDGGQFLPTTTLAKMPKRARKELETYTDKKQEIEPFVWETPDEISKRSLWDVCRFDIQKANGKYEMIPEPIILQSVYGDTEKAKHAVSLAQRWLNGERWIHQDEAPMFWWKYVK